MARTTLVSGDLMLASKGSGSRSVASRIAHNPFIMKHGSRRSPVPTLRRWDKLRIAATVCFIGALVFASDCRKALGAETVGQPQAPARSNTPIRSIFEDRTGNLWFGTDGDGVFRFDGRTIRWLTERDGLANGFVSSIQEDNGGTLWFGLRGAACRYDGHSFTHYPHNEARTSDRAKTFRVNPGDVWFGARDGAYRFDGSALIAVPLSPTDALHKTQPANSSTPYSVYSILKDREGNVWFGTEQRGVCRYDGTAYSWITEHGLSKAAVRSLFQDHAGNLWFGNNGDGVYRYDGQTLTSFTDEHGVGNPEFATTLQGKPGTLARIWTMAEDRAGSLWFGTIDAGVWRYDGKVLTNVTNRNGLTSNSIWTITCDRQGEIWIGTDQGDVLRFNGMEFKRMN